MFRSIHEWIFGRRKIKVADDESIGQLLGRSRCPDCRGTEFYEGPSGGMSVNILCSTCGHEFNFCPPVPEMSHRNSSEFQPHRNWAFGLPEEWKPALLKDNKNG